MRSWLRQPVVLCLIGSLSLLSLGGCIAVPPPPPGRMAMAPGQPLPPAYQGEAYAVDDWQARGLYEPAPGYTWRYVDGQYVLVAVASGIIAAAVLGALLGHGHGHGGPGPRFGPR